MCMIGAARPTTPSATPAASGATGGTSTCPLAKFPPGVEQALKDQRAMLEQKKASLARWNDQDKADFKKYFGSTDEAARKKMQDRVDKELALNKSMTPTDFKRASPSKANRFAYVYPDDKTHTVYLDQAFDKAPSTGKDSKAGTLCHEMSHFKDIGGTSDHAYGQKNAIALAKSDPASAQDNADNFEYYCENP